MSDTVYVKILDKDYQIACPPGQQQALHQAAQNLDQRMRAIRSSSSVIGLERIAIMAALNLSHDLLEAQSAITSDSANGRKLADLSDKIESTLQGLKS